MTVVICTPGQVFTRGYVQSLYVTLGQFLTQGVGVCLTTAYSGDVYIARTDCVTSGSRTKEATILDERAYDWLLWVDSDMAWQPEDIFQLIERDLDVVTGLAPMGDQKKLCVMLRQDDRDYWIVNQDLEGVEEPFEIEACGMGFLLMRAGVLESLEFPWFRSEVDETGLLMGEDLSFCRRVKEAGYRIFADPRVLIGHEKQVRMYPDGGPTRYAHDRVFRLPEGKSGSGNDDDVRGSVCDRRSG